MDVNGGMEADLRLTLFQLGEIIVCLQVQASVNRQCTRAKNAVNALNMELLELSLADVETSRMEPGELDSLSRSINLLHTFMRDANRCQVRAISSVPSCMALFGLRQSTRPLSSGSGRHSRWCAR